jgi:glyoxylase-like metal-dependent hydrolase (beta-lactamase superfamily II)
MGYRFQMSEPTRILPEHTDDLGFGIYAIDTGFQRPRFDAAYLVVEQGRAAFIDTGTNFAVPRLLETLHALGLTPDAVDYVIPTHVHLDHAGGVGLLMQSLPTATLVCHPRGLRHLVDPSRLWQSATVVYGEEEMRRSYGELVNVPAERARPAKHHHCIWDARSQGWFTGDTFGLSYREFDQDGRAWALPTSTPVQFEPEAMKASIARMLATHPQRMYVTHYGVVHDVPRVAALLSTLVDRMVAIARAAQAERHASIKRQLLVAYTESLREHGCALSEAEIERLLHTDLELNAQGLEVWLGTP